MSLDDAMWRLLVTEKSGLGEQFGAEMLMDPLRREQEGRSVYRQLSEGILLWDQRNGSCEIEEFKIRDIRASFF